MSTSSNKLKTGVKMEGNGGNDIGDGGRQIAWKSCVWYGCSSHPIPSYMSSKQFLLNCFHLIRALKKFISTHLSSSARKKSFTVSAKSLAQKTWSWDTDAFTQKKLTTYFVLQSLHKALPSTTLYSKACRKNFPALLCTTKLAQSTSQFYLVLQSLH